MEDYNFSKRIASVNFSVDHSIDRGFYFDRQV